MNHFNKFPIDVQSEILSQHPSYFRIKKNLNEKLFYDRYCQKPISASEFLSYIKDENPSTFVIFTLSDATFNIYYFDNGVRYTKLYIEETDVDEYVVTMQYTYDNMSVQELLEIIKYDEIYFDLITTFKIASRRNCEKISSGYNKQYTLSVFNEHAKDLQAFDLFSYFNLCKTLLYYSYNYDLLAHQSPRMALHRSGIGEIIFNTNGDIINEDQTFQEIIEDMILDYDFKNDIIDMIL